MALSRRSTVSNTSTATECCSLLARTFTTMLLPARAACSSSSSFLARSHCFLPSRSLM
jgi:hypothetical protein